MIRSADVLAERPRDAGLGECDACEDVAELYAHDQRLLCPACIRQDVLERIRRRVQRGLAQARGHRRRPEIALDCAMAALLAVEEDCLRAEVL